MSKVSSWTEALEKKVELATAFDSQNRDRGSDIHLKAVIPSTEYDRAFDQVLNVRLDVSFSLLLSETEIKVVSLLLPKLVGLLCKVDAKRILIMWCVRVVFALRFPSFMLPLASRLFI
jgi:hypothetical protein